MKFKKMFIFLPYVASLVGCSGNTPIADVIVYGQQIYTSNESHQSVTAFAVKDKKYLAVGSQSDVDKFKGSSTKIYNTAFAMPGAVESHGHWILEEAFKLGCYISPLKEDKTPKTFEDIIEDIKKYRQDHPNCTGIYGYGFDASKNGFPDIALFDKEFPDIPVFISEASLHGAYLNSKCFELAGALYEDPEGVTIDRNVDHSVMGIARDEACTYLRNKVFGALLNQEDYKTAVKNASKHLNACGYVMHYDTWSNFDGTDEMYKAINAVDKSEEGLNFLYASSYCIESFEKQHASEMIDKAVQLKNSYSSNHYKPDFLKLFADGVVEAFTGYCTEVYKTESMGHGTRIWEPSTMNSIVSEANRKGLKVHVHTMGDAACEEAIDAFVASENANGYTRNSIAHVAEIQNKDLKRLHDHNLAVSSGAYWRSQTTQEEIEQVDATVISEERFRNLYPCKEFVDNGVKAALHTDNPCLPGILDLFGYIQVLINGLDHSKPITDKSIVRNTNFIGIKDAIDMFTINGAWMNNLENERGSIEVGKYADFILADKNPFAIDKNDIWTIKLDKTFFEGKEVFARSN